MNFDIIIGNPPYQDATASIYPFFIAEAIRLKPRYINMIVRNNWLSSGTLKDTRDSIRDNGLKRIINYPIVSEVFKSVDVAVNIFFIDMIYKGNVLIENIRNSSRVSRFEANLKNMPVITVNGIEYDIARKVLDKMSSSFSAEVYPCNCFRLQSNMLIGYGDKKVKLEYKKEKDNEYNVQVACISDRVLDSNYIKLEDVPARDDLISHYKVVVGARFNNNQNVITNLNILEPESICTESYGLLYSNKDKNRVYNAYSYIKTRFFRFLLGMMCDSGMTNMHPYRFNLIPMQDFSKSWTDEDLYKKYSLTEEEIDYIKVLIRPIKNED